MPRVSETSEFTVEVVNKLLDTNAFDRVEATGNTIHIVLGEFEAKLSARPIKGFIGRVSKFSKEDCIQAVAEFLREAGVPSSTKYNQWSKINSSEERDLPSTAQVMGTLGCWPARSILTFMLRGEFEGASPEDIINKQAQLDTPDTE